MSFFAMIKSYAVVIGHLLKTFTQLFYGIWRVSQFKYAPITIFGGTHLEPESIYIQKAQELARMLASADIPVLTGGGPGIMEAANCGAFGDAKNIYSTMGILVKGLEGGIPNKCAKNSFVVDYFFARKLLLVRYSCGFAVFPGGFGTMDELMGILTLIQTKSRKPSPIVLIGVDYWQPFINWLTNYTFAHGLIEEKDLSLFILTDSVEEAYNILKTEEPIEFAINP